MSYKSPLLICLIFILAACSPVSLLNATIPSDGYRLTKDIAYGDDARQRLDVYVPDKIAAQAPVVLFLYGGSWKYGRKADYTFVAQALTQHGFIVAIADYRLYPQVQYPDFVDDGAKALAWVHNNIASYGGNAANLFVAGHSAGAFNAVMLTVNDAVLKRNGVQQDWIRGTIGIAGPYDFTPSTEGDVKDVFKGFADADTQPIHYITSGLPPMLLVTGGADDTVQPRNTYNMAAKLKAYHNSVETQVYPNTGHIGIILSLADGFQDKTPLLRDMTAFINQHSR